MEHRNISGTRRVPVPQLGVAVFWACVIGAVLLASRADATGSDDFVTTWDTTNVGTTDTFSIRIPTSGGGYAYQVDWNNDGDNDDGVGVDDEATFHTGAITHTFATAGVHTIRISGSFPQIRFNNGGDKLKLLSVDQWGSQPWRSSDAAFYGCTNLSVLATDGPDLSLVTNATSMFRGVRGTLNVGSWDTGNLTTATHMFRSTTAQLDVETWDTANITNMQAMFAWSSGNPDVSEWDTGNVTTTVQMFREAGNADPDVSGWDTTSLITSSAMFQDISSFTGSLRNWDTTNLTDVSYMFARGSSNPDLSEFDTSNVTNFNFMFFRAGSNPDVSAWDTSSATTMSNVFSYASNASPDVSGWDTSNVTNMSQMFQKARNANPDMSDWNMEKVSNLSDFLADASLSVANFDAALIAWSDQDLRSGLNFDAGSSQFCAAGDALTQLMSTFNWTIDNSGQDCTPETPTLAPSLDDESDTGHSTGDQVTSASDVTVLVGCTESGNVVNVFADQPTPGTLLGTHTCTAQGSSNVTVVGLVEGIYSLTYTETNRGFESAPSGSSAIEVDLTPPTEPVCEPSTTLAGIGESITMECTGVEVGSILAVDNMTCTPSPTPVSGNVSCSGVAGPNDGPTTANVDASDDAVVVSDVAGNTSSTSTGVIVDVVAPVIALIGDDEVLVELDEPYIDQGATCVDERDPACLVLVTGSEIDTAAVGSHVVSYSAVDSAGNEAVAVTRTVAVGPAPTTVPTTTTIPTTTVSTVSTTTVPATTSNPATTDPTPAPSTASSPEQTTALDEVASDAIDLDEVDLDEVADAPFVGGAEPATSFPTLTVVSGSLLAIAGAFWWFLLGRRRAEAS